MEWDSDNPDNSDEKTMKMSAADAAVAMKVLIAMKAMVDMEAKPKFVPAEDDRRRPPTNPSRSHYIFGPPKGHRLHSIRTEYAGNGGFWCASCWPPIAKENEAETGGEENEAEKGRLHVSSTKDTDTNGSGELRALGA